MTTWNGTTDLTGPELQRLVGRSRHTLHADQRAKLLARPERRERVKAKVFKAADVRRYLKHKFPHLLP
jgi:hypothetical protein